MLRLFVCLIVLCLTTGCTRLAYKDMSYWTIGQRKSLRIKKTTPDGVVTDIQYNTEVDPVVSEVARIIAKGAGAVPIAP